MRYFITGTDTGAGKTVAAAWLMLHMQASYWKPIQCGTEEGTDAQTVSLLTGCDQGKILPSAYVLSEPLSPHEAAKRAGTVIDMDVFSLPEHDGALIVEGAGGIMVPLNGKFYMADLMERLGLPVILVCRTSLGTINHTLLSLEALRNRSIEPAGVILSGPKSPHNRAAIETYGKVKILGELPVLEPLGRDTLLAIKPETGLQEPASIV